MIDDLDLIEDYPDVPLGERPYVPTPIQDPKIRLKTSGLDAARQLAELNAWKKYCEAEKEHFLDWGSLLVNQALRGFGEGDWMLIAGSPNFGKSQSTTSMTLSLLEKNEDLLVLDFSIDDPKRKRLTQYAANLAFLEMNAIDFANTLEEAGELTRFEAAVEKIEEWTKDERLVIYEIAASDTEGKLILQGSVDFIQETLIAARLKYPKKKLLLVVDSLNNINVGRSITDDFAKTQIVADEMAMILTRTKAVMMATSHLRKINGRRPTLEDVKGNNYLAYGAKVVIGIHNDVKLHADEASLCWTDAKNPNIKMPIVEARFVKNKASDFNSTIFFRQWPAIGKLEEVPEAEQGTYRTMLRGI